MKEIKDAKRIAHIFQNGFRTKKDCIEKAIEYNKKGRAPNSGGCENL